MLQPAPEMYQCASCGSGPSKKGFHWHWSLSHVSIDNDFCQAVAIVYNSHKDKYEISSLMWAIEEELPVPSSVTRHTIGIIDEDEKSEYALPIVWLGRSKKLKNDMFTKTWGPKEIVAP